MGSMIDDFIRWYHKFHIDRMVSNIGQSIKNTISKRIEKTNERTEPSTVDKLNEWLKNELKK